MGILDFLRGKKKIGGFLFREFKNTADGYSIEIPADWMVVGISEEYGHMFSDEHKQQGMLAVRQISALFYGLEKFSDNLIAGMERNNNYILVSRKAITVNGLSAIETVFKATALVNGREADAAVINAIIHYPPAARFYLISYSALQKDVNRYVIVYLQARDSFRAIGSGH